MTGVMERVWSWWDGRSLREQRMLAIMFLLMLACVIWLGVVRPLAAWRDAEAWRRERAESSLALAERAAMRLKIAVPAKGTDLSAVVNDANALTGLAPQTGMSASGGFGFTLTDTPTTAAFGWLAVLHDKGVDVGEISVVKNTDATVTMEGTLIPSG